jgi:hypothetical protein
MKFTAMWPYDEWPDDAIRMTKADLNELVLQIRSIDVPYARNWISELRSGQVHTSVALLLTLLPNLQYLRLGESFQQKATHLIESTFRAAVLSDGTQDDRLYIFQHLQDVVLEYPGLVTDPRGPFTRPLKVNTLSIFYVPSVERITIDLSLPGDFSWPGGFAPSPTKIRLLNLTGLKEGHLGQILSITPILQNLRWQRRVCCRRSEVDVVDLDQMATDLSYVKDTLTKLTIPEAVFPTSCHSRMSIRLEGSFPTFRCLCVLKGLSVPLPFLIGFCPTAENMQPLSQLLPRSIEWLTLKDLDLYRSRFGCEQLIIEWIRLWLLDWKVYTPCLRGFRLWRRKLAGSCKSDFDRTMINGLKDLAAQSGIKFETTSKHSLD